MSDRSDEEIAMVKELFGDELSEKEMDLILNTTVASEPVEVKLKTFRYLFKSDGDRLILIISIIFILIGWALGQWTWWLGTLPLILGILGLVCVVLLLKAAKRKYLEGLLIPAIVTSTTPLRFLAFANMSKGGHAENDPFEDYCGIKLLKTKSLSPHTHRIGEILPCAATFREGDDADCWVDFDPSPVCWGTANRETLNALSKRLDSEDLEVLQGLLASGTLPKDDINVAVLLRDYHKSGSKPKPPPMPQA